MSIERSPTGKAETSCRSAYGKTQGFDIQAITQNSEPCDVRPDRLLGQVYRVPILSVWTCGGQGSRRTEVTTSNSGLPALETAARGVFNVADSAPRRGRKRSSSDSSATSTDERRQRKAAKKAKKRLQKEKDSERKRTKDQKELERQEQKEAKLRVIAEKNE